VIRFDEWEFPDGEEHLQDWMTKVNRRVKGRLTYQHHKYEAAIRFCRGRRVAVDVGAHIGLWSWTLAGDFGALVAFEPVAAHRAAWRENMAGLKNARLEPVALGARPGQVRITPRTPGSSGDTGVDPVAERSSLRASVGDKGELVECRTLDSFELPIVDFLKIDCEGFEVFVVEGARDTITRCRPCVIVEQKPETGMVERYGVGERDAVDALVGMGATLRRVIQGDYILSFD
jgi:FkbM family methyltransferase